MIRVEEFLLKKKKSTEVAGDTVILAKAPCSVLIIQMPLSKGKAVSSMETSLFSSLGGKSSACSSIYRMRTLPLQQPTGHFPKGKRKVTPMTHEPRVL